MGFDNECIVNIQSLPGEYFCPVCRTLVYPNDSLQAQCTHIYCKPCLAYVVATTHACPYDGYLVTEADAKPLSESNKELSETISKVAVHCLYHRSGCTWQGTLAECTTHCAGCSFGNSPVVCNRCGTQIVHSQVQEHAQICPGVQPQVQADSGQPQAAQDPTATASATATTTAAASATVATTAAASAATAATAAPPSATTVASGQAPAYPQAQGAEQWYQQQQLQYQQYYQQYPGYDPYQQQYQQYYQQQAQPYMQLQMQATAQQVAPGQQQPQPYMHPQPQPHGQPLPQQQPQHQVAQPHPQQQQLPPPQPQLQPPPHMQAQPQPHVPAQQPQAPPPHGQIPGQPHPQPHQLHPQPQPQARPPGPPQHQQPVPPQQHPPAQMPYPLPHPQQQLRPQHPPGPPQTQQLPMQPHPQPHLQTIPPTQASHPPAHAVSGYHSYGAPQPRPNQMQPQQAGMLPPYQQPPQMQGQFPPNQPAQMRPPHAQIPAQVQQHPAMAPPHLPPANLHPGQPQVHQPMPQAGMQQLAPPHGFPPAQPQGHLHSGQMQQQQGAVPFQQQMYSQQPFRPQGPAPMQQQVQARPMVPTQGMPQQPFQQPHGGASNVVQPGQSPKQAYPTRSASQVPKSSELQQSQVPQSGEQGNMVPTSPATAKQGASLQDKSGQVAQSEVGMNSKAVEGAKSTENIPDHVSDANSDGKEEKPTMEAKEKTAQTESDRKEHHQIKQSTESHVKAKEEEVNNSFNEEIQGHDRRPDEKSGAQVPGEIVHAGADKVVQRPHLDNPQAPPQMPSLGGFGRGQPVLPSNQSVLPVQERGMPQLGYHERNTSQFSQQYPPARPPFPNQERFPPQQVPYGPPPNMTGPVMASQRPAAPDRMFPQPMPQESRFPEPPPPHPMQVPGQGMPPAQMRPPAPGHTPLAPEPFWPPPQAAGPGPGLPPPPSGVPFHHGFRPNSFEQSMPPPGQSQTHMPPPHAGGARATPGEPLTRPTMVGPPPGALDTPNRMMGGGVGQSPPVNPMEAEAYALKRSGVYDGRNPETLRHLPTEHASYGQQSALNMNGMPNKGYDGGMHDPAFGPSMGENRYRRLPEEGFNAPQDRFRSSTLDPGRHANRREFEEDLKQFPRPAYLDEGPKYDGYMSSSRPSDKTPHVSGGSRPLPSFQSGAAFPPSSAGSVAHLDVGERDRPVFLHEHMGRKHDAVADHPNTTSEFGRHRLDVMPPLRSPGREYDGFSSSKFGSRGQSRREDFEERDQHGSQFKAFNFPPPGPGYFGRDIPDAPGSLRADQLRRGLDGPDIPNIHPHSAAASGHGFGISRNFPGVGEHGRPGLPSHMHFGDSGGFNGHFSSISREGEFDGFEQSRKRKPGSMGWCRICKIDCETVEGLDLHAQTREHQKMTMDLVLSIKQDNARKHKLTSENATPFEDPNRSRKAKFENRGKRQ